MTSKVWVVLVGVLIVVNVCKRWASTNTTTQASLWPSSSQRLKVALFGQRNLAVTDYQLPQTVERKEQQSRYEPLPPIDLEIAQSLIGHEIYARMVNVDEELPVQESTQIPYFWHIHKSGGSTMKELLNCFNRSQTHRRCESSDEDLKVCSFNDGSHFVNVDTSNLAGIDRASRLGLFDRHFDNLVVDTSRVYDALDMFTAPTYRARLFLLLRDPVERAISKFYYLKIAKWERNYKPGMENMTLLEYADSGLVYNDWITRRLVNKMRGHLTSDDFVTAKEVLRQKALILMTDDMTSATERLLKYFAWPVTDEQTACANKFLQKPVNKNPHPLPPRDSEEWQAIADRNTYDALLYEYAKELYAHQSLLLNQMPTTN